MKWQPIETAPKDGSAIRYRRIINGTVAYEGLAVWRTVKFHAMQPHPFAGPIPGDEAYDATDWMMVDQEKRVPEPTHWMPLPPAPTE